MNITDAHYCDENLVALYDHVNAGRQDFDFYLSQLPSTPHTILDIGCGTGTFALELAELGHQVTGLDPSAQMIETARSKVRSERVNWVVGTSRDLAHRSVYDLVFMTGHAFQCLLTDDDIASLFQDMHRLVSDTGRVWLESRNPYAKAWENWTPERSMPPVALPDGGQVRVSHRVLSLEDETVTFEETYEILPSRLQRTSISTLRFADDTKIMALAERAGLVQHTLFGDWTGQTFDRASSPEMIFCISRA
jgi:ubiquinone/menaquinone biosynthesis C-methylase UbiE